jgi:hypothetical protein
MPRRAAGNLPGVSHHTRDNGIIAAGLMRYGFIDGTQRISSALVEAADNSGRRLPELFCGFSRHHFAEPVPYQRHAHLRLGQRQHLFCSSQASCGTTRTQCRRGQ